MKRATLRTALDRQSAQKRWIVYRLRFLPQQLEAARHKVRMLENEARRYGLTDLLTQKSESINHV